MKESKFLLIFLSIILMSFTVYAAIEDDVIFYYSANTDATDNSGNGYDGDFYGDAAVDGGVSKIGSGSFTFDGSGDAVGVNDSAAQRPENFSVSFWKKSSDAVSATEMYIAKLENNGAPGDDGWFLTQYLSNDYFWWTNLGGADLWGATLTTDWTHYVITYNNSNHVAKVYRNNVTERTDTLSGPMVQTTSNMYIGASYIAATAYFSGHIDEVIYWGRILTDEEVTYLYNESNGINFGDYFTPPIQNLYFFDKEPQNGTNFNNDIPFYYEITVDGNCSFYANDNLVTTNTGLSAGNLSFDYNLTYVQNGSNSFNISCDFVGDTTENEQKFLFFDNSTPYIDYVNWVQQSDGLNFAFSGSTIDENFNLNISCTDENLYYMNVSLTSTNGSDVDYNFYQEDINDTTFVANESVNIGVLDEGSMSVVVQCADAHTAKFIPPMDVKAVSGGLDFDGIKFYTTDNQLSSFSTVKFEDRYSFDLSFNVPKKSIEIIAESPYPIKYRPKTESFVTGDYWFDFKNVYGFHISNIVKTGSNRYSISLESSSSVDYVRFQSIGIININSVTYNFSVDVDTDNVTIISPLGTLFTSNASQNITFSYIPYYEPTGPDNCSLVINDTLVNTSFSVTKNVVNYLYYTMSAPAVQDYLYWGYQIYCNETHFHPPDYYEIHQKIDNGTFALYNNASLENCDICLDSIVVTVGTSGDTVDKTFGWDYYNYTIQENNGNPSLTAFFNVSGIYANDFNFTFKYLDLIQEGDQVVILLYNYSSAAYELVANCTRTSSQNTLQINITDGSDFQLMGLVQGEIYKVDYWSMGVGYFLFDYFDADIVSTTTTTASGSTTTTTLSNYTVSYGMTCHIARDPFFKEKIPLSDRDLIDWVCEFNNSNHKRCISYVEYESQLLQSNPNIETIESVGQQGYFDGYGQVKVYFTSKDIVPNFLYNFTVKCDDDSNNSYYYIAEINPQNKAIEDYLVPRADWIMNSFLGLILIGIFGFAVYYIFRRRRR